MGNCSVKKILQDSFSEGTLRACFVDCQIREYSRFDLTDPLRRSFYTAQNLAINLRKHNVPIHHFFMLNGRAHKSLKPFQYKDKAKDKNLIQHQELDFQLVIPEPTEWVYPKVSSNGFKNKRAVQILNKPKTTLICAGFMATDCLKETIIGSFNATATPEKHRVIVALDATNLCFSKMQNYMSTMDEDLANRVKTKKGVDITQNILYTTSEDISDHLSTGCNLA